MKTYEEGYTLGWADAIYAYESKQRKNMSTVDELMALADEYARAVADSPHMPTPLERPLAVKRIEAARAALESALQAEYERGRSEREQDAEPVAWQSPDGSIREDEGQCEPPFDDWTPLYASPPKRKPLTDGQIGVIKHKCTGIVSGEIYWKDFARAIERAHGIGDE